MNGKVIFKDLKAKVGVDDIAYHLGYRLDRSAGVGRYIEMALTDGSGHTDKLIIKNPKDKAAQTFFCRNGAKGGDVVSLIRDNLNAFHESGHNEWEIIGKVLARFANAPIPDYGDSRYLDRAGYNGHRIFCPERYEVKPVTEDRTEVMAFFAQRGIKAETVERFAPFLSLVRDKEATGYPHFNLGFPYTQAGKGKVLGYEIRGFGQYKRKAAGTDSSSAAWIANLSEEENVHSISNVYFAESGYDIMAFYQANRLRLDDTHSVFVSLGGTFSDEQVRSIMRHYSEARAVDCFDNDLPGRIYGIRMAALLEGLSLNIQKTDSEVRLSVNGKTFSLKTDEVSISELGKQVSLRYKVGQWKAAPAFKDWNDQIMNKPMKPEPVINKFQRDRKLAEDREKGVIR